MPYKVNYQNLLRYFQVDVVVLREKYGLQSLRGYDPDDFDDEAGDEDGDDDEDGEEAKEAKIEEIVEKTEDEWAETVFSLQRLAIFFNNRTNDGCVLQFSHYLDRTLTSHSTATSPRSGSLRSSRGVSSGSCSRARSSPAARRLSTPASPCATSPGRSVSQVVAPSPRPLTVCPLAVHPAHLLLRQAVNVSTLGPGVRVLFPEADSILPSPIVDRPDPVKQINDPLPDVFSAVSIVDDADEDDELGAEVVAPPEMPTWDQVKQAKLGVEEKEPDDPEQRTRRRIAELKERFEREAKAMEAWQKCGRKERSSTSVLKDALGKLQPGEEEVEGEWRVGYRERSARSFVGWDLVYKSKVVATTTDHNAHQQEQQSDEHSLVKIQLSAHQRDFPVTDALFFPSLATQDALASLGNGDSILSHTLDEPLAVLLDLSPALDLKHLDSLKSSILEADLTQLVFVPTPPNDTVETLWIVDRLWRVIPSYWHHAGELLREEPGRVMSHPGGYGPSPQEALAKIEEEMEAEEAERARKNGVAGGEAHCQPQEGQAQEKVVEIA